MDVQLGDGASAAGADRRDRPIDGHRSAQGRRHRGRQPASARRLHQGAGRRPGRCDRQPVRARPHRHHRDRLRAPAPDPGAQWLLHQRRHPDRCRDQSRQLRRTVDRWRRPGDRDQLTDREPERRERGRRVRGSDQDRGRCRLAAGERRGGPSRLPRSSPAATSPPDIAQALNLPVQQGVLVEQVLGGGPADDAGIKGATGQATIGGQTIPIGGDIITKVDGKQITGMNDVISAVNDRKPGDDLTSTVWRRRPAEGRHGQAGRSSRACAGLELQHPALASPPTRRPTATPRRHGSIRLSPVSAIVSSIGLGDQPSVLLALSELTSVRLPSHRPRERMPPSNSAMPADDQVGKVRVGTFEACRPDGRGGSGPPGTSRPTWSRR